MSHIVRELSHIYKEVKLAKKNPVVRQNTIANTNPNDIVKSIESNDSFLENMTGSDGFDQMKQEAVKRITAKINKAGSISNLSDVITPDDTLSHAMKSNINNNFSERAKAIAAKPNQLPKNYKAGFRRTISQRQMSSLESFVRT